VEQSLATGVAGDGRKVKKKKNKKTENKME
jgi:hypothetical protein